MKARRVVDLFAGGGFFGDGFAQAGFQIVAAVELDKFAAASHRRNHPDVPVLKTDIRKVGRREIYKAAGLKYTDTIDLVIGSPPCQGWSIQGRNDPDDPRRSLIYEFVRLVVELRPKHFVFENVKGLTMGKNRAVFETLIEEFSRAGYDCAPWQVLNARHYGVAQDRQRLILLGSRRDCPLIEYPEHQPPVTCKEVLWDLEDPEEAKRLTGWERTVHTPKVIARFSTVSPGGYDRISRFKRLAEDGVAPTQTVGTVKGSHRGGRHTAKRAIHYKEKEPRVVTVREAARLHSIRDEVLLGLEVMSKATALALIGNSVPPNMARAIALKCLEAIDQNTSKKGYGFSRKAGSRQ